MMTTIGFLKMHSFKKVETNYTLYVAYSFSLYFLSPTNGLFKKYMSVYFSVR